MPSIYLIENHLEYYIEYLIKNRLYMISPLPYIYPIEYPIIPYRIPYRQKILIGKISRSPKSEKSPIERYPME